MVAREALTSNRTGRTFALVAALCAFALALPAASSASTPEGTITGTVTAAATQGSGEKLQGIFVHAFWMGGEPAPAPASPPFAYTNEGGEYSIKLPEGQWGVEFINANYLPQFYREQSNPEDAEAVSVTGSTVTPGIDAKLQRAAMITGTVTAAASGSAIYLAEVCVLESTTGFVDQCVETEPDGTYTITGLRSGTYKVEFSAGLLSEPFVTQYWEAKPSLEEATPIPLSTGDMETGIDAALVLEPTSRPPEVQPPLSVPPPWLAPSSEMTPPRPHKCRHGYRKRRVNGRVRCVKIHHHRRHRHHHRPAR